MIKDDIADRGDSLQWNLETKTFAKHARTLYVDNDMCKMIRIDPLKVWYCGKAMSHTPPMEVSRKWVKNDCVVFKDGRTTTSLVVFSKENVIFQNRCRMYTQIHKLYKSEWTRIKSVKVIVFNWADRPQNSW